MTSPNDRNQGTGNAETRHANPDHAATDPQNAARQDQMKADHDAMQESARRVEASVSSEVRNTPVQHTDLGTGSSEDNAQSLRNVDAARDNADAARESARTRNNPDHAVTDPHNAAQQEQVKADHDALQESGRRVQASVTSDVRNTPVQQADNSGRATEDTAQSIRNVDEARNNADAARESARRVDESVADLDDRNRR